MAAEYFDERMETLAPEILRTVQDHRLRWQFRRCWDGSPFYRARFEAAGLTPDSFQGLADLERLPLLTLDELRAAGMDSWQVAPPGWLSARSTESPHARRVTDGDAMHVEDRIARGAWAVGDVRSRNRRASVRELDAALRTPQRRTLPPISDDGARPARYIRGGEAGSSLAYQCCQRDGYHWCGDHALAEIVDPVTLSPVPESLPGELVITDLVREASPVIRLRTGLVFVASSEPCPCGRTGTRLWTRHGYKSRRRA